MLKFIAISALVLAGLWAWVQARARAHETRAELAFSREGQMLDVDGYPVHAVVLGKGPDLVLIHGSSGNTRDMSFSLAPRLARHFRVIILDRPGLGYTAPVNPRGASLTQQADLLVKAAQQLGADRPIVLGHSYGGAVALAWAVHHPDALSALIPVSAPSYPWTTGLSTYYRILSHPVLGPVVAPILTAFVGDDQVKQAVEEVFAPNPAPPGYLGHIGAGLTLRRQSLRANALQRANLLGEIRQLTPHYPGIHVPTEIIHGDADTTVSLSIHSKPLAKTIPDARLTSLPGIGHMPHHAAEAAVVAVILRAAQRAGLHPEP